jgi:hypothetical protein
MDTREMHAKAEQLLEKVDDLQTIPAVLARY